MKIKIFFITHIFLIPFIAFWMYYFHYYFTFQDYNPLIGRNIFHFFSSIFIMYVFTFLMIRKNNIFTLNEIVPGMYIIVILSLFWEVLIQPLKRFLNNELVYIQFDQIVSDLLGMLFAYLLLKTILKIKILPSW